MGRVVILRVWIPWLMGQVSKLFWVSAFSKAIFQQIGSVLMISWLFLTRAHQGQLCEHYFRSKFLTLLTPTHIPYESIWHLLMSLPLDASGSVYLISFYLLAAPGKSFIIMRPIPSATLSNITNCLEKGRSSREIAISGVVRFSADGGAQPNFICSLLMT